MTVTLTPWRYAADPHLPMTARAARYYLILDDLPLEPDLAVRAQALRTMGHAARHRYVLPTAKPAACVGLVGPNVWPAVWVGHPLTQLDALRVATLLDAQDAWCRVVLSPATSSALVAAARAAGAVVLEARR